MHKLLLYVVKWYMLFPPLTEAPSMSIVRSDLIFLREILSSALLPAAVLSSNFLPARVLFSNVLPANVFGSKPLLVFALLGLSFSAPPSVAALCTSLCPENMFPFSTCAPS